MGKIYKKRFTCFEICFFLNRVGVIGLKEGVSKFLALPRYTEKTTPAWDKT